MKRLPDQRTNRAASLNDRSFRPKRAAGADGNRCGNRFQDRNPRLNAAAVHHHRLHGLGYAVPFNLRRSILRHEANDDSANHRNRDHPQPKLIVARAYELSDEAVVKENVGEQADQFVQHERNQPREQPDAGCKKRYQHHAELRRFRQSYVSNLLSCRRNRCWGWISVVVAIWHP